MRTLILCLLFSSAEAATYTVTLNVTYPSPQVWTGEFTVLEQNRYEGVSPLLEINIETPTGMLSHTMGEYLQRYWTDPTWDSSVVDPDRFFIEEQIGAYYEDLNYLCCITWVPGGEIRWGGPGWFPDNPGRLYFIYDAGYGIGADGTYTITPVPLPAAGWLLMSAFGLLLAHRR